MDKFITRERRYTRDHEWVDFYETRTVTGISWFKLIGFRQIHRITFVQPCTGFRREGELLAVIIGGDYQIAAHMPLDGHIVKMNEELLRDAGLLISHPEDEGWIAEITPWEPEHHTRLVAEAAYNQKYKRIT